MKGELKLFKLFGINVKLHASWWLVFILLSWILSTGFFPQFYSELTTMQYWLMGIVASILLFVSVLLHEFSHSLVAKHFRIKVEGITLFFFGGVSAITKEDIKPWHEFWMALAGPLFSFVLAGLFYILYVTVGYVFVNAIAFYLFQLNLILGIFNLVPAYPLDGGRVFRALLRLKTKDLRKSTRIAAKGGKMFAWFLGILGALEIIAGNFGGIWFVVLGIFLHFIANASYQQVVFRQILGKWDAKDLMDKKFKTVLASESLAKLIENNKQSQKIAFVVKKDNSQNSILGVIDLKQIGKMNAQVQNRIKVEQATLRKFPKIYSDDDCYKVFKIFSTVPYNILPVYKRGEIKKVVGIITREKIIKALEWHINFGTDY
jgi:Zn-dependent protease